MATQAKLAEPEADLSELPWQIKVDALGYPSIYGTNEDGGEGDLIAHCFADHEHLIRSAPELLTALEDLEAYLRNTPHHNAIEAAAARKVIALANGAKS